MVDGSIAKSEKPRQKIQHTFFQTYHSNPIDAGCGCHPKSLDHSDELLWSHQLRLWEARWPVCPPRKIWLLCLQIGRCRWERQKKYFGQHGGLLRIRGRCLAIMRQLLHSMAPRCTAYLLVEAPIICRCGRATKLPPSRSPIFLQTSSESATRLKISFPICDLPKSHPSSSSINHYSMQSFHFWSPARPGVRT